MKKILSLVLVIAILAAFLGGCGTANQDNKTKPVAGVQAGTGKGITIRIIQNKVEIADVLTRMKLDYEKENPGVKLKFETFGGGADYDTVLVAKFQSGDAPDVFVNEGYAKLDPWIEKVEDLSDQPWVKDMIDGTAAPVTRNGKLYGMPEAIEGFGFAYNKALFAKAGITTLPNTLKTLDAVCKKLQAAGIQPFSNTYAEWWALGIHNMNLPLAHQPNPQKFIDDIAAGNAKFKDNPVTAGWIRLLDLTVKYGQKNATSAGDYATSVNAFAAGKAAMIQQGNWIQPDLDKVDPSIDVAFLPMPISDTPEDRVSAGIPNYWVVNKESKVSDQVKVWLDWMITSETGKHYITNELKFIPAFKSIKATKFKGLNAALFEFVSAKKTYGWESSRLPNGATVLIGIAMMKYLGKQSTAEQLYEAIDKAIIDKAKNARDS